MKVKVCGLTNTADAVLCENLGADALGFIFYEESKRYISPKTANDIIKHLSPFTLKVGVFVNENSDKINAEAKTAGINIVQLHGNEKPEQIPEINLPVIKAFRIDDEFDFKILEEYKNCYFLFDTYSSLQYGGTGKTFNWDIIPKQIADKIILSGGISISNIKRIIDEVNPYAVDLSSSVEEYPGKKSELKLKQFFNILKGKN